MLDEEAAPPGPLAAEDPPLMPPLDELVPPEAVPPLDDPMPPPLDVEPVPLEGLLGLELLELDDPGVVGVVEDEDEEDPPGTTMVSRSFVVELVADDPLGAVLVPPGITVVVSFFSHADNAKALNNTSAYPLCFMFTLLSSENRCIAPTV